MRLLYLIGLYSDGLDSDARAFSVHIKVRPNEVRSKFFESYSILKFDIGRSELMYISKILHSPNRSQPNSFTAQLFLSIYHVYKKFIKLIIDYDHNSNCIES